MNFNSGKSIWKQRSNLKLAKTRLKKLAKAIDHISDSSLAQYAQMFAITLEFKPDLVVEFGRAAGNSTAVLTEAANQLESCKVISICLSSDWQQKTIQRIAEVVSDNWFDRLDARIGNILDIQFRYLVKNSKRILLLWDAHGWDVAEYVLGVVLPALRYKEHLVLVHDISYFDPELNNPEYSESGIWKGQGNEDKPYLMLGPMSSPFGEMIALLDFASRNKLKIRSVEEEIRRMFEKNKSAREELTRIIGEQMASPVSSFHLFSLNNIPKTQKIFYPKFQKKESAKLELNISIGSRKLLSLKF